MKKQKFAWAGVSRLNLAMEVLWLAVIFALPLVFFPNIYTTFELAKVVVFKGAATLLLLLWLLKCLLAGTVPKFGWRANRWLWFSLVILAAFYLLAVVFSVAPALSVFGWYPRFQGLLTLGSYAIFGMVVFFELRGEKQRERLVLALMAGFLAVCGIALLQKFLPPNWGFLSFWNDREFDGRLYGTMANPNYLATYVVMILPLVFVKLIGASKGVGERIFAFVCAFVGILALLFTLSRAGFLAFGISLLVLAVVAVVRRNMGDKIYSKKAAKSLVAFALVPLLAGGFLLFVMAHQQEAWVQNSPLLSRLTVNETSLSSVRSRLEIWPATVKQILASPWFGYGPETFAVTFPLYAPTTVNWREDKGEIADHAHNEILDTAVQIGIPGMIAYLCFIFGLMAAGVRKFLKASPKDENGWLILGLSSGILGLFVANEFGFSVTVHWVFLIVFAAVILNLPHEKSFGTVEAAGRVLWWCLFIVVAVLSVGMFWLYDVRMIEADLHMRQGYNAVTAGDVAKTTAEYATAAQLAPLEPFYSLNLAYAQLQRLEDGQNLSTVEVAAAIQAAEQAARLRGNDRFALSLIEDFKKHL